MLIKLRINPVITGTVKLSSTLYENNSTNVAVKDPIKIVIRDILIIFIKINVAKNEQTKKAKLPSNVLFKICIFPNLPKNSANASPMVDNIKHSIAIFLSKRSIVKNAPTINHVVADILFFSFSFKIDFIFINKNSLNPLL